MRITVLLSLAASVATSAPAQLTRADLTLANVTFTINDGAANAADRDITWKLTFSGSSTALYRFAEGTAPTGGWLIAPSTTTTGAMQLRGRQNSVGTIYMEVRRDAQSPIIRRTASIRFNFLRGDHQWGNDIQFDSSRSVPELVDLPTSAEAAGYGITVVKVSGRSCRYGSKPIEFIANGDDGIASITTVCEFRLITGKLLPAGWTVKSARVRKFGSPAATDCRLAPIVSGSNNPALIVTLKHPGSANPFDQRQSMCRLSEVIYTGPDDPDLKEWPVDVFRPPPAF